MPTLGETRVRTSFNPSKETSVDTIKNLAAAGIDFCDTHKVKDPRLAALAMDRFEEAAMWAVKLVTTP